MCKISIIVPVYNNAIYLNRCVDSILNQKFTDFELILVNDGSRDRSGQICDEYCKIDSRVKTFHKDNGGVSSARNLGLDNALGEWVTFVDSDDWIDKTMYLDMYNTAIKENADVVYCDINMVYCDKQIRWQAAEYDSSKISFLNNFIMSEWTSLCNVLAKRSLFVEKGIKCPESVSFYEDYHVVTRLMYFADTIAYLPKPLYSYNRINESSALHNYSSVFSLNGRWVNLDLIYFFKKECVYDKFAKTLSWRLLKSAQDLVLDRNTHDEFINLHPDSLKYICTCPNLPFKRKILMWLLAHRLNFITDVLLYVRRMRLKIL